MATYNDIARTFTTLLKGSVTFKGRLHLMPHWGTELNSNTLGALLDESLSDPEKQQFPLVAMMPPRSRSEYHGSASDYLDITLLFLTTTYYEGTSIKERNRATGTSKRSIAEDWDQMRDAAIDFMSALERVRDMGQLPNVIIAGGTQSMQPISTIGTKRLSGVMLQFTIVAPLLCDPTLTDYPNLQGLTFPPLT